MRSSEETAVVWVDVCTQDEFLVRGIAEHLDPMEHLHRIGQTPSFPLTIRPQTLLVLDSRSIDPNQISSLVGQATRQGGFVLIIVPARAAIDLMGNVLGREAEADYLVWPSHDRILGTRLDSIRHHFARAALPRSVDLAQKPDGARMWSAIEWLPTMIAVTDSSGTPSLINAAMRTFVGEERLRHHLGLSWLSWIHPDDHFKTMEHYAEAISLKRHIGITLRMKRADDQWRQVRCVGSPVFEQDDSFAGFVASLEDITDQRVQLEQLRNREAMFVELAESIPLRIAVVDPDGNYTFRNTAFRKIYHDEAGKDPQSWWHLHPDDFPTAERANAEWTKGHEVSIEIRLRDPATQNYVWNHAIIRPLRDAHGAIERWIFTSMDVDDEKRRSEEIKRLYGELNQESATKRDFLAALSHELRTPLNVILGYCHLLDPLMASDARKERVLSRMISAANFILNEVEKLPWPDQAANLTPDFSQVFHVD